MLRVLTLIKVPVVVVELITWGELNRMIEPQNLTEYTVRQSQGNYDIMLTFKV